MGEKKTESDGHKDHYCMYKKLKIIAKITDFIHASLEALILCTGI